MGLKAEEVLTAGEMKLFCEKNILTERLWVKITDVGVFRVEEIKLEMEMTKEIAEEPDITPTGTGPISLHRPNIL